MKRIALAVIMTFVMAACSSLPSIPSIPQPTANVDVAATSQANVQISVAQTLTAQPTPTSAPVTDTPTLPIESPTLPATETPLPTSSPLPNLTTTPVTATSGPGSLTTTPAPVGQVTATWTLAVRTYGTLPPLVPSAHIILINKAKAEAYISLHVDLDGSNTVIEYPVTGTITIRAPLGFYRYVAWVGGREMVGEFRLHDGDDLTITLYKDRIEIK
jgi:hypothetical protein